MAAFRIQLTAAALAVLIPCLVSPPAAEARAKHSATISGDGQGQGLNIPQPYQSPVTGDDEPDFTIFGVPVRISSPVAKPYRNSAFRTYQGGSMTSQDALTADTIPNIDDWTP